MYTQYSDVDTKKEEFFCTLDADALTPYDTVPSECGSQLETLTVAELKQFLGKLKMLRSFL